MRKGSAVSCAVVCAALLTASSAFAFTAVPTTAVYDRQ